MLFTGWSKRRRSKEYDMERSVELEDMDIDFWGLKRRASFAN